jgi:hypothetical protein
MAPNGRKELLRGMAKKILDNLVEMCIIEGNHTGKVIIEMNLNQGVLTDVKVSPEIRA